MEKTEFYQTGPSLSNTFSPWLQQKLSKLLPTDVFSQIAPHLKHVGQLAVSDWLTYSREAESTPPTLKTFDPWGRRIDEIQVSEGWRALERAAAVEGIVASAYERKFGSHSRLYQAALLYLFHPSSAFVSCPLAMSDGAARAIELFGDNEMKANAFKNLISRDPLKAWTSGQWMTERTGGSDVSQTSTTARLDQDGTWLLNGVKWFTSATTSQMAMLLARPDGAKAGSQGLSLFYTELRREPGSLEGLEILRLKKKLGTDALPTAELRLVDKKARLVGELGGGVRKISSHFNITRVYNSVCAVGHLRRALDLAWSYAAVRTVFGKKLIDQPLHRATLKEVEAQFEKCFDLTFYVAGLLGRDECGEASEAEKLLLRALTPIVKLFTARMCMSGVSEVVESFGGAGYIEETGIPRLLRDAQVFSIWEGTTNVLALDFLRAVGLSPQDFILAAESAFKSLKTDSSWALAVGILVSGFSREEMEVQARRLSFLIAEAISEALRLRS